LKAQCLEFRLQAVSSEVPALAGLMFHLSAAWAVLPFGRTPTPLQPRKRGTPNRKKTRIPYQNLINLYLRECAQTGKNPALSWPGPLERAAD
jgi:hypothetical protein